ncbi:MAG: LPS assembly lipoprotein LptE [Phycisphaerae bacterium]
MRLRLLLLLLLLPAIQGCGYSAGYSGQALYRQDVSTVAVPIFANRSYYRGDEFRLSQAVAQALETKTPYKVADVAVADTVLEGEIVSIALGNISRENRSSLPQEQVWLVSVNFTWKDQRTGEILVLRRNFEQSATFYPMLGESTVIGSQLAAERLAEGIVQQLQTDF